MFKILDYLDKLEIVKETNTHLTCICPVCGDDNLKIKRTSPHKNAYRCWSNNCEGIREALGFKSLIPPKKKKITIRIKPSKVNFTGGNLATVSDYKPLKFKTKKFSGGYTSQERVYPYSKTQRVLRIDNLESKVKYIFIQYLSEDFVWVSGTGNSFWPIYQHGIESVLKDTSFDTLLMVEGEKTAEFCKERGLAAVTLMAGNFHDGLNKNILLTTLFLPNIKNIIYVPDNDAPGLNKAEKVQEACWRNGLGCKIVPMSQIVPEPFEGMDLADLDESTFIEFKINVLNRTKFAVPRDAAGISRV